MGRPVRWEYTVTLVPADGHSKVQLHRVQQGTDTRFLWAETTISRLSDLPGVEDVLQALYTGVVGLMEVIV